MGCRVIIDGKVTMFPSAKEKFTALAKKWRESTLNCSNANTILLHPCHLAIIGMGQEALPFIFEDMKRANDKSDEAYGGPWFVALEAITQQRPVPEEHFHDSEILYDGWLAWASSNHLA